jgi:probable HAF family extracellular repeat protein
MHSGLHRFGTGLVFFALSIFCGVAAHGNKTPRFDIEPLQDTAGGAALSPEAINNRGEIVGTAHGTNGHHPFLLRNGIYSELTVGGVLHNGFGTDINDGGDVLARVVIDGREHSLLIQRRGKVIDLNVQTGLALDAIQLNDRGIVLANVPASNGIDGITWHKGEVRYVVRSTNNSGVFDINNRGEVLTLLPGGPETNAYGFATAIVHGDSIQWLGPFVGIALNDRGNVAGEYYSEHGIGTVFHRKGVTTDIGLLPGDYRIRPSDINNRDWMVGSGEGAGEVYRAFLYADGELYDLNDLIPVDSGWVLFQASAINDRGEIVGYGAYNGRESGFRLTPRKHSRKD